MAFRHGIHLPREYYPKTPGEVEYIKQVPYALAIGSLMYTMSYTRLDICCAVAIVSRYQSNSGPDLVYSTPDYVLMGNTDYDFQADRDSCKSTSGSVFTLGGGAIIWGSVK